MYHYDPNTALEELTEDATLPNPVHLRDMILRKRLTPDQSSLGEAGRVSSDRPAEVAVFGPSSMGNSICTCSPGFRFTA